MSKIYQIKLKQKSGLLSELQSDTIFGHFAWRMLEMLGEEKLTAFLEKYRSGNPVFTVSDGFLYDTESGEVRFPKPLKLSDFEQPQGNKAERIRHFEGQKKAKNAKYVSLEQLNDFLNGKELKKDAADLPEFKAEEDLRTSVEIDRGTLKAKEGRLFTYKPVYQHNAGFSIFVKTIDEIAFNEFQCREILNSVFELGFGKRKSGGYGQFEVTGFEEFTGFHEPDQSAGFISLSQFLPAKSDGTTDAYYEINVKYGKLGEQYSLSANPFKAAMLLMKPGSCFSSSVVKEFYGRIAENISDYNPEVIHNGIAFTLKMR